MRKLWIAAIACLAAGIGCIVAVFPVRAGMLSAFPAGGLYVLHTDSYLAVPREEGKFLFEMSVFEVKKGAYTPLLSYEDICLLDTSGSEWPAASVNLVPQFADFSLNRTTVQLSLAIPEEEARELVEFNRVRFSRGEEQTTLRLGSLKVELVPQDAISDQAATYEQTSTSSEFSLYRVSVYNLSATQELVMKRIRAPLAGATCTQSLRIDALGQDGPLENAVLPAKHQGVVTLRFTSDQPFCHNLIRPLIVFELDGREQCVVAGEYARYVSAMDRSQILAYLNGEAAQ